MYDAFHIDQYDILYRLDEWNIHRVSQNIFIDYRSWSNIYQTLSMFINQCDLSIREILFLSPVQIEALEMSRSGLWAESFSEYVYESFTVNPKHADFIGTKENFWDMHKVRSEILYRSEKQPRPKMVIIMHGELLTPRMLKDCNNYLRLQTVVCFDSAMFYNSSSIVNHIRKPLKHVFLNEETTEIQKYLYNALEKRLIPLSNEKKVRVHEYNARGLNLSKIPRPVISITEDHPPQLVEKGFRGSLIYTTEPNWNFSLEPNRYHLIRGMYLVVDAVSRRDGMTRMTMHPTYTKYKYKVVPDVQYKKVDTPCMIDDLPQWKFSTGSILTPKTLANTVDAARLYNAINLFEDSVSIYIL